MKPLIVIALLPVLLLMGCQEDKSETVKPRSEINQPEVLKADLTEADSVNRLVVSTQKNNQVYNITWASIPDAVKYRVRYELQGSYLEQEAWSKSQGFKVTIAPNETYSIEIVAANSDNEIIAKTTGFSVTNKVNILNDLAK